MQPDHEPIDFTVEVRVNCECGAHVVLNDWGDPQRCAKCGRGYQAEANVEVYGVNLDAGGVRMAISPSERISQLAERLKGNVSPAERMEIAREIAQESKNLPGGVRMALHQSSDPT